MTTRFNETIAVTAIAVLCLAAPAAAQCPPVCVEPITGFETNRDGDPVVDHLPACASLDTLNVVMFEDPTVASVTAAFIVEDACAPGTEPCGVCPPLPPTEESFVADFSSVGFGDGEAGVDTTQLMDIRFQWADPTNVRWALVQTSGPLTFGDPSVHLEGIIRFRVNIPDCSAFEFFGVTCPANQVCDPDTQLCIPDGLCVGVSCGAGELCDPATGECVPENLCTAVSCPAGEICDPDTGGCVLERPCQGVVCPDPDHEVCDPATGTCIPGGVCQNLLRTSPIGVALMLRETGNDLPQGFLDNAPGRLEFVGVDLVVGADTDSPIPVPTNSFAFTDVDCDGSDAGDWIDLEFDLDQLELDGKVVGWTFAEGDGILDATDLGDLVNRGVLAGLVLTVDATDFTSEYVEFLVDKVEFEAPVQDPTIAPRLGAPLRASDTSVTVNDVLSSSTDVTLEIDRAAVRGGGFVADETCSVDPGGNLFVDITLANCNPSVAPLEIGDQLRSNQTNPSGTSDYSPIVSVNPAARFSMTITVNEGTCLDPEYEFVGAEATLDQDHPLGKPVDADDDVWQTVDFLFDGTDPVLPWVLGDGALVPDGGTWAIDAIWMNIDINEPAQGPYQVLIDGVQLINLDDSVTDLLTMEDGVNRFASPRGQSDVQFCFPVPPPDCVDGETPGTILTQVTTEGSFDGTRAVRLQWLFQDTSLLNVATMLQRTGSCGTRTEFPDSAKGVRFHLAVRDGDDPGEPIPIVAAPVIGDAPMVTVTNVDGMATLVELLVNGNVVNSAVPAGPEVDIDPIVTLVLGQSIAARQTISARAVSDPSWPRVVTIPPAPTVAGPLSQGQTVVTVNNVMTAANATASLVTVIDATTETTLGTKVPTGSSVDVPDLPELILGHQIVATQTVNGEVSPRSFPVIVGTGQPPPPVKINEYQYDDSGTDDREFVELYNAGVDPEDISGWTLRASDTTPPPGDDNSDYTIPGVPDSGTTVLAAGDYYVLGTALVPNVDQEVGVNDLWEDSNEALELLDGIGLAVDTFVSELNKGAPAITTEGGFWGNFRSEDTTPQQSLARWIDGRDTDLITDYEPPDVDALVVGTDVAGLGGSFVNARVIDPTLADIDNPNAITASPQGGNAIIAWDSAGGGNMVVSEDVVQGSYTISAYLDTAPYGVGGAESTTYGLLGSTGTFYNMPDPSDTFFGDVSTANGNTGIGWLYEKEDSAGLVTLRLIDFGDGGDSSDGPLTPRDWTIITSIDLSLEASDWYRLSIDYDGGTGNAVAKFDNQTFNFTTETGLVGAFYVGYRESLAGVPALLLRPPTFDLSVAVAELPVLAHSCITHGGGQGEFCLPIGPGNEGARTPGDNVEPRFCGTDKILVDFAGPVDAASLTVSVDCLDNAGQPLTYNPTIIRSQVLPETVQLDFSAPLPNILGPSCCTLTFGGSGSGEWSVASVPGDVSRDLEVSTADVSLVKPKIGPPPLIDLPSVDANFWFDLDCGGEITLSDKNLVKPKVGAPPEKGSFPACPCAAEESQAAGNCADEIDNDCDNLTDGADPGCL
ncbi:MAG: lamin tail domain-containing protein [Planctomycetota bacterium]